MSEPESATREQRFVALVQLVADPLHRYAVRRTDPTTAQDVVADALLVIWRRLDDVPRDDPLPWCYAVARGCLANARRGQARQRRLVERLALQADRHVDDEPPIDDSALHCALESLSAGDRELVRLWAWEGLAPRDIGVVLGITANAASIRLHRAKRRLAEQLSAPPAHPGKSPDSGGQEQGKERRPQ